jgi:NAD(P)-dependent dehydrogenase (short-subunit alcohol dehydrogenase family)
MKNVLITGSSSGLGKAIATTLFLAEHNVLGLDKNHGFDITAFEPEQIDEVKRAFGGIDFIINCAGINQNEWFEDVTREDFDRVMHTNAYSMVALTQAFLPELIASKGCVINIVSNAAHIPMTSSLAYNASKAAALMITKQMAHELTPKHGITVFSISPNKLEGTKMSRDIEANVQRVRGWTPEYAREYQRKALMHGLETPPAQVAAFIANLITTGNWKFMSGCDIPFGK